MNKRIAATIFVGMILFAIGVVVPRWRGRPAPPVAGQPAIATNPSPEVSLTATNEPAVRPSLAQPPQERRLSQLQMMKDSLGLSDEQVKKLQPVLKEQQDKLNALRRDTSLSRKDRVAKLRELQQGTGSKIKAQLTPQQAEKWQQVRANPGRFMQQSGQPVARTNTFSIAPQGARPQPALPAWQSRPSQARQPPQPAQPLEQKGTSP